MEFSEKKFKRTYESLKDIFKFNARYCSGHNLNKEINTLLDFVSEELFTNQVKFHPESKQEILIGYKKLPKRLIIKVVDFDVQPYDVTESQAVDTRQQLRDRKPGGLGLHLVKQMVDLVDYQYRDQVSTITLIKNLE